MGLQTIGLSIAYNMFAPNFEGLDFEVHFESLL